MNCLEKREKIIPNKFPYELEEKKEGKLSGKLNIQILEKTKKNFWENCLQKVGQFNFWKRKTIGNNIQTKVNIIAKKIIQH